MKILVVDDDKVTVELLSEVLESKGHDVETAMSAEQAASKMKSNPFPVVISDIRMKGSDGLSLLRHVKDRYPRCVVVLMTAFGSVDTAVEAVKSGAFDYISKPFEVEELVGIVTKAIAQHDALCEERRTDSESFEPIHAKKTLIGKSRSIVEVFKSIARAAVSESNVLILGESGTGKELVAKEIHSKSSRSESSFIAINCGALTDSLLESELFGHEKGAFTNAFSTKKGLLEDAHMGTLFLDEIGDISSAMQIKLLRVLQEGEFKAVGSNVLKKINVRVIAATHRNLSEMVKAETFREDLYFRLKVIQINLPPLRERIGDLNELIAYFLSYHCQKMHKSVSHVAEDALEVLKGYSWPGNIRELEHSIEHAVVMAKSNVLFLDDFPAELIKSKDQVAPKSSTPVHSEQAQLATPHSAAGSRSSLEDVEKEHIIKVLTEVKFNKSKAAEILGIDRATLYRKAARYHINIDAPSGKGSSTDRS